MSNHSLTARGTDLPFSHKSMVSFTHGVEHYLQEMVVGSRPMKRKEKIHRMMIPFTRERIEGAIFYKGHVTYLRYRPHVLQKRSIFCHLVVPVYLQMKNY